ncbi:hypothetical protein LZ31DRAFT_614625 [Colletotrichum somersetense]|nr:hypothetical protein LZ31DRAFT_614625 [Colletotrichum somersetense]
MVGRGGTDILFMYCHPSRASAHNRTAPAPRSWHRIFMPPIYLYIQIGPDSGGITVAWKERSFGAEGHARHAEMGLSRYRAAGTGSGGTLQGQVYVGSVYEYMCYVSLHVERALIRSFQLKSRETAIRPASLHTTHISSITRDATLRSRPQRVSFPLHTFRLLFCMFSEFPPQRSVPSYPLPSLVHGAQSSQLYPSAFCWNTPHRYGVVSVALTSAFTGHIQRLTWWFLTSTSVRLLLSNSTRGSSCGRISTKPRFGFGRSSSVSLCHRCYLTQGFTLFGICHQSFGLFIHLEPNPS